MSGGDWTLAAIALEPSLGTLVVTGGGLLGG